MRQVDRRSSPSRWVRRGLAIGIVGLLVSMLPAPAVAAPQPGPAVSTVAAPTSHTPDPTSVAIAGSLQSELGCPGDWQPECATTHLTHDAADDVWQGGWTVPPGTWEYKAALNGSWTENYGANAAPDGANLALNLADAATVKFYYDHKTHWITSNQNATIAVAPGSFQSELGCTADWQADCLRSWLQDPDGDGTYAFTTTDLPAGTYEAKVAIGESWDVNYGAGGTAGGDNIPFTVGDGDSVEFSYDDANHVLTITATPPPPPSTSVALVGDLQSEIGCPGDWQPECAASELTEDATDGVWQQSFDVPAGEWQYKVALNDSWDVNYGDGAEANGPNISLSLAEPATVKFYFDPTTHWVTSNRNATIAVAPGSFQSELGCPGDWQPDCLRSWLQDIDADGIYTFTTTDLPPGDYEGKVAIDESWNENYGAGGEPGGANIAFTVTDPGDPVAFSYDRASNVLTITTGTPSGLEPGDEDLVRPSLRDFLTRESFYFVLPDRFQNGTSSNDDGGLTGDRLSTGLDATDKGFYHGGDLAGLIEQLDYLDQLGVTALWMAPVFKNRPVQGAGSDVSAGYHGYWVTDFTQIDPHFGTNAEMAALVEGAHARGMKVFFDIITNHTADVIDFAEGTYTYRSKAAYPYADAEGVEFDDRDYVDSAAFPELDPATSFPYTPVFRTPADAASKVPAWLNDRTMYHNRGNSTFVGENAEYGDFFGLDDLFTERREVVDGMIAIHQAWIEDVGIDGFRIDTAKHVNLEFWQRFSPEVLAFAGDHGAPDFFMFGEVFDSNPAFTSIYATKGQLPAVLDFPFQSAARSFASQSSPTDNLRALFANDDYYTDADSNAYSLPTFLGNHDMGRIGNFLRTDNPGATDDELLARSELAHALMYLSRGMPVVYYGDEQGFTGDGGDKDARQDMFPSQVASYNDDDLIGTDATTADANFDQDHPLYESIAELADLTTEHPALRDGTQVHRYSTTGAGIYAFSRVDRDGQVEYVVALNNAETAKTATIPTYMASSGFTGIWPAGLPALTSNASRGLTITVPPLSAVVYRADGPLAARSSAPGIDLDLPAAEAEVTGRVEVGATLGTPLLAEVTFAVKVGDASDWTILGTDDNAPYRVYFDTEGLTAGTPLSFKAIVRDHSGNLNADKSTAVVGAEEGPTIGSARDYAVIHYHRDDGDYSDWGLHLWGDIAETIEWTSPKPLVGEDDYGRFAWVKLQPGATSVGVVVHKGDEKDPPPNRFFNPATTPEIWLQSGDETIYPSQAAAQGYVEIRYQRPDDDYTGWGLHLWGDAIDPSEGTEWANPKPPTAIDDYGAYWKVLVDDPTKPVNFIVHRGDEKDTAEDRSFLPTEQPAIWLQSGDSTVYGTRGGAEDFAIIHYHRDDGEYGDATSSDFNDFWGMHVWTGSAEEGITWQTPLKPIGEDGFGLVFRVRLVDGTPSLSYIIHRGDIKDPPPDQSLDLAKFDHEVWYLSGHVREGVAQYVLPVIGGPGVDANLEKQKAHWLTEDTLAWDLEPVPFGDYFLDYAPTGGLEIGPTGITGGTTIPLGRLKPGLSDDLRAKWPHLADFAAFRIPADRLAEVPDALRGQLAISVRDENGLLRAATGIQIPGVLDDLYANDADLGVTWQGATPTIRVWAPTAKSVALQLFDDAADPTASVTPMTLDPATGVWSITGRPSWKGRYYLFDVEVFVRTTGVVEHNVVTDPYSLNLAMDSARSQIVDLADPALAPAGWTGLKKPAAMAPEAISIYELHVRDFSWNDDTVPLADRGTYRAFSHKHSDGMEHLAQLADDGLTHVHLLPVFDIATIEEDRSAHQEPPCDLASFAPDSDQQQACISQVRSTDGFNWGYDPWHYTTPEGSYATDPNGTSRIVQFREMVASLNQADLRVVMDVVYNHTNASGQAEKSVLDRIVPGYYHRLDLEGTVATSTCCQNTATEHAMMEKLMVDSVVTWARAYKVDGFRFDLMGHHSKANMLAVRAALDALTPAHDGVDGKSIYVYGEGWNFGEVADGARFAQATQPNMAGTGIGTFNDRLRDAVRGGGPFDPDQRIRQGFASGLYYDPNPFATNTPAEQRDQLLLLADQIRVGLTGNLKDYEFVGRDGTVIEGSDVDYNGSPAGYNADPSEAITYVEAHDNEVLYDILAWKLRPDLPMAARVRSQVVAQSFVALGQGVAFYHAGSELLRSKSLDRNSYDSGDWFNRLFFDGSANGFGSGLPPAPDNTPAWDAARPLLADPALRPSQSDIAFANDRFAELLRIRASSPLFHLGSLPEIQARMKFLNTGPDQTPGLIVMRLSDLVGADFDPGVASIVVVFNATDETQTYTIGSLAGHQIRLHPVQLASKDPVLKQASFARATGTFSVPARTSAVFVQPQVGGGH